MIFQTIETHCGISRAIQKQESGARQNSDRVLARLNLRTVRTASSVSYKLYNSGLIEFSHKTKIQKHSNFCVKNSPKIQEQVLACLVCILGSLCMVFVTSNSLPHVVPPVL